MFTSRWKEDEFSPRRVLSETGTKRVPFETRNKKGSLRNGSKEFSGTWSEIVVYETSGETSETSIKWNEEGSSGVPDKFSFVE